MPLPKKIRIGYKDYQVIPVKIQHPDLSEAFGLCDNVGAKIFVRTDMAPEMVADTLLHEIMHAVWYYMGLDDRELEENAINRLSSGLICAMIDNPDLLKYLTKTLIKDK